VITIGLTTDGPHSPQYRAEVEDALAECARVLVYATREGAGGLEYPADAYRLIGALYEAIGRVPQLLGQTGAFLSAQAAAGKLGDDQGRDPAIQAGMAADLLEDAASRIASACGHLQMAQGDISGLSVKGDGDA
jgi:hypothetical protein